MAVGNFLDLDEFERKDHQILTQVAEIEGERFSSLLKKKPKNESLFLSGVYQIYLSVGTYQIKATSLSD
jgi:hypothetical protein